MVIGRDVWHENVYLPPGILCNGGGVIADPCAAIGDQLAIRELDRSNLDFQIDVSANVSELDARDNVAWRSLVSWK